MNAIKLPLLRIAHPSQEMCDQELKKVSNKIKNIPHEESLGDDLGEDFVRNDQEKKVS